MSNNALNDAHGLNPPTINAPTAIPTNNELYTSFVIKAKTIAMIGGKIDHTVPINIELSIFFYS